MFVKVCGITSEEDALLAVAMGADAVGFVFAPSPRQIAPQTDIVHYDCSPANVLASATSITGVIDWDGWCAGDRMFDVATMLFYSYADVAVRTCLWQTILKYSGPEAGAVYLGHLIHRQVDWSIRYHSAKAIEHWLRISAAILGDLAAYR